MIDATKKRNQNDITGEGRTRDGGDERGEVKTIFLYNIIVCV